MSEAHEPGSARHRATSPGRRRATPPPAADDELSLFGEAGQYRGDPRPHYQSDALGEYLAEELEAGYQARSDDYVRYDRSSASPDPGPYRSEDVSGYLASDDPGYRSGPAEPYREPAGDPLHDPLHDPLPGTGYDPLSEPHDPLTDPLADRHGRYGAEEIPYHPAYQPPAPEPQPEPQPRRPDEPEPHPPLAEDPYASPRAARRGEEPLGLFAGDDYQDDPRPAGRRSRTEARRDPDAVPAGEDAGLGDLGFRSSGRVRHRRFRGCLAVLIAVAVIVGGIGFALIKGQSFLIGKLTTPDYTGTGSGQVMIQVQSGQSSTQIAATLEEKGVVKSAKAFTTAAKTDVRSRSIQPGFYRLRAKMSGAAALALLLDPKSKVVDHTTIPEGYRLKQIVDKLAKDSKIPRANFDAALKDPAALGLPAYAKGNPQGFLFPARYDIDPGTTAESLLTQMVDKYDAEATDLQLVEGAKSVGRTPHEVVVIASLIQAEARRPEDFGKVARVIYNRLAKGQRLQLDSTVHFAVGKFDLVSSTAADRASKSPYNTYRWAGLPPGPINSPGEDALTAALEPTPGTWMFFTTTNPETGETKFATTSDEFEIIAKEFQAWCRAHPGQC